jgi:hypothetical protein
MTRPTRLSAEPAHSAARPSRTPWPLVLVGVGGLVLGGLVVGGLWLENSGPGGQVGTQAIALPGRIAEYVPFGQVDLNKSARAKENVARIESWDEQSGKRLSKSNNNAAAVVRVYADKDLKNQISVMAYRAAAPNPQFVPYQDAATLGLVHPPEESEQFSEVSCVVRNDPTAIGSVPGTDSVHTSSCLRSNDSLTVEIRPTGDISNEPQRVADLVDEVWDQLASS